MNGDEKLNTLYESRNRGGDGMNSLFLDASNQRGRASVPASYDKPPPGFSEDLFSGTDGLSSSIPRHFIVGSSSHLGSLDRQAIGENLVRSHSAAPSLDGRLSMGLPPGLANRETPLVSNRSGGDSYLESAHNNHHVLQQGQRRPASTGVIGEHQSSSSAVLNSLGLGSTGRSGAVRPAAKTLMDLIQEDFPPEAPMYGLNYPREDMYLERPRTTSPLSQQSREHYQYHGRDEKLGRDGTGGLTEALNRFQIGPGDAYNARVSI
jgi:hypothetical protein